MSSKELCIVSLTMPTTKEGAEMSGFKEAWYMVREGILHPASPGERCVMRQNACPWQSPSRAHVVTHTIFSCIQPLDK